MNYKPEPDWIEVDPKKHKWIVDNWDEITDGNEEHFRDVVLFVPRGKGWGRRQWPLLMIGLRAWPTGYWDKGRQKLSFTSSIKVGGNHWWEERYGVPPACLPRVSEKIKEVLARLAVPQTRSPD